MTGLDSGNWVIKEQDTEVVNAEGRLVVRDLVEL